MLMRHAPAGSTVHPLAAVDREFPFEYVRGTMFTGPGRELNVIVINDHPTEMRSISLTIPGDEGGRFLHALVKDRSRTGVVADRTFVTASAPEQTLIQDTLSPLALHVYTTSSVRSYNS